MSAEPPTERSAEIVPLRSPVQTYAGGPNVVPIRPGALRPFLGADEGPRRGDDNESVELTVHERDAFREIARALPRRTGKIDRLTSQVFPCASGELGRRPPADSDALRISR